MVTNLIVVILFLLTDIHRYSVNKNGVNKLNGGHTWN